jgi:hypothetical protein
MPNLDAVASPQGPPAAAATSPTGILRRLLRNWDILSGFLLVVVTVPPILFSPRSLHIVWRPGLFDDSWILDTSFKAARGIWFGHQIAFNWGPLFQWLSSALARWTGVSMGGIYETFNTLPLWCGFLLTWLAVRLLLPEQAAWKRFLLVLLLSIYWSPFDLRAPFSCFLFAAFLRGWYALRKQRMNAVVFGGVAALLCVIAFLNKADNGVYGVAALLITLAGVACEDWKAVPWRRCVYALLSFTLLLPLLVILVNWSLVAPFDFRFWKQSLAFVSGFRWSAAAEMNNAGTLYLFAVLFGGTAVLAWRWFVSGNRDKVLAARRGYLLSAFVFALLTLQSAIVRGDHNHIQFAAFPMIFLAGVALFSFRATIISLLGAGVATAASLLCGIAMINVDALHYRYTELRHPTVSCPAGYSEIDRACYPERLASDMRNVAGYLQQHSSYQQKVAVFPYQYAFADAAQRDVADGVEQSFLAATPYLRQWNVEGAVRSGAPVGLYFPDGEPGHLARTNLSFPIDGVSNFTRSPEMWLWLFHHFRADPALAPGVVSLLRDDSREARISMRAQPLLLQRTSFPITTRESMLDLGTPAWPAGGADFLRLRLKITYGPLWKLRKPEKLQLEITRADGSRELKTFIAEPNVATDVWIYPWTEEQLGNYFQADESLWRQGSRSAIVGLRLFLTPLDWVSETPRSVTLEAADAVRFEMQ